MIEQISDLQKFVTPVDIADFGARPSGIQIEGLHRQPRVHAYRDIDRRRSKHPPTATDGTQASRAGTSARRNCLMEQGSRFFVLFFVGVGH